MLIKSDFCQGCTFGVTMTKNVIKETFLSPFSLNFQYGIKKAIVNVFSPKPHRRNNGCITKNWNHGDSSRRKKAKEKIMGKCIKWMYLAKSLKMISIRFVKLRCLRSLRESTAQKASYIADQWHILVPNKFILGVLFEPKTELFTARSDLQRNWTTSVSTNMPNNVVLFYG